MIDFREKCPVELHMLLDFLILLHVASDGPHADSKQVRAKQRRMRIDTVMIFSGREYWRDRVRFDEVGRVGLDEDCR